jgi:hypothetical protein
MNSLGVQVIRYHVADANNLAVSTSRTVVVRDTTPPTIQVLGQQQLTVESCCTTASPLCAGSCAYVDVGARATDVVHNSVSVVTTGLPVPSQLRTPTAAGAPGIVITYTATDGSGNVATATRTVRIVDTTVPIITLNGGGFTDEEASVSQTYTDAGATCADVAHGAITAGPTVTWNPTPPNMAVPGTYVATYACVDPTGLSANAVLRTVVVQDTLPPTLHLIGSSVMNHQGNTPWTEPGFIATDSLDGVITSSVQFSPQTLDIIADAGVMTTFTYRVTDAASNSNAVLIQRNVTIIDTIRPIIFIPNLAVIQHERCSDLTSSCNDIAYYSANDTMPPYNLTGDVLVTTNATIDYTDPHGSTYDVTYSVSDRAGNTAFVVGHIIQIIDTIVPQIWMNNVNATTNETSWDAGVPYVDAGAQADDTVPPYNLTDVMVTTGVADVDVLAAHGSRFEVNYTVSDGGGNTVVATRTVVIADVTPPEISLVGSCSCRCEAIQTATLATGSTTNSTTATPGTTNSMNSTTIASTSAQSTPNNTGSTTSTTATTTTATTTTGSIDTCGSFTSSTCSCPAGFVSQSFWSAETTIWEAGTPWVDPGYVCRPTAPFYPIYIPLSEFFPLLHRAGLSTNTLHPFSALQL